MFVCKFLSNKERFGGPLKNQIRRALSKSASLNKLYFVLRRHSLIYKLENLNDSYYKLAKDSGDKELEHQIGRLTNFKKTLKTISREDLAGDIIEFGTWRGFSTVWIAYLCENFGINKKIVTIDSFEGLQKSEGDFKKGAFKDTSLGIVRNYIYKNRNLSKATKKNISVVKAYFSEKEKILNKLDNRKFCFVHMDCDLSKSIQDVFDLLIENNLLANYCFIHFDDYGLNPKLRETANKVFNKMSSYYKIKECSHTNLTKNFEIKRRAP